MGFTLAEAQWLVKFMRGLPGQAAPSPGNEEELYIQALEGEGLWPGPMEQMRHGLEMQAMEAAQAHGGYSDYPMEEYYDEYW
jgi:hypothetical protein